MLHKTVVVQASLYQFITSAAQDSGSSGFTVSVYYYQVVLHKPVVVQASLYQFITSAAQASGSSGFTVSVYY